MTDNGDPGIATTAGAERKLNDRKLSWANLHRGDSFNLEAGRVSSAPNHHASHVDWGKTLSLAFQSIGVVYGDIGTSPLYVFSSTFTDGIKHVEDVLGVLSLIIYTILLIPFIKYTFLVLWANDNGEGGTFALYSLLSRHARISLVPNQQPEDSEVSNYRLEPPPRQLKWASMIKKRCSRTAVGGISSLSTDAVVGISVAILIGLFLFQRFGTDKVGFSFAPIISVWFAFLTGIGWISLGGVILCITGTEAMFADLGHFNVRAIQISFSTIVLPSIVIAHTGQAAYLTKYPEHFDKTFYKSIPGPLYLPQFVVAVLAAIISSQAMISGTFSIISQSLSLGCFPKVKVIHTSAKYEGQVYIPEINYMLMVACVIVTAAFKTTTKIGNAYDKLKN
ncbi:hypothetical protein SLE2022_321440 [Rubroshorea leprosula]